MTKNNSTQISFWQNCVNVIKDFFSPLRSLSELLDEKFPNIAQNIQLTFIYIFAMIDLFHGILNSMISMGYLPEIFTPAFPFIKAVITNPILRILASPEKIFFFSFVVLEFMVNRPNKFSKLVKYNILLLFSVLMIQGLMISYWDLLFNRTIASPVLKWSYDQGTVVNSDRDLALSFFFLTFCIFFLSYIYFYFKALSGKFLRINGMEWLTDSVAFWLKIKTPTMRIAKGYGKKGPGKKGPKKKK